MHSAFPAARDKIGREVGTGETTGNPSAGTIGTQKFGELKSSVCSVPHLPQLGISSHTKQRNRLAIWRLSESNNGNCCAF